MRTTIDDPIELRRHRAYGFHRTSNSVNAGATRHFDRFVLLLVSLTLCVASGNKALAGVEYRLDANEFEGYRNAARLWVEYDRVPPPDVPLPAPDEAELARLWAQFGAAARNIETAWTRAFESDPLLERASACLNRFHDLEWQYQELRQDVRREYGYDKFNEFETQGRAWIVTNGKPWLELDDTNLIRLFLWWESMVHAKDVNLPPRPYQWLTSTEPYASDDADQDEELTEMRAIEICRDGIRRQREQTSDEHKKIAARLDLPPNLKKYLEIRHEADAMHQLGYTYLSLHLPEHTDIATAEAEFERLLGRITAIRPDMMVALHGVHKNMLEKEVKKLRRQREALLPSQ